MSEAKYTRVAMALHWITVGLVAALFIMAWTMEDMPKGAERAALIALHKSFGISVFLLTLLRLGWRAGHKAPALPGSLPAWQSRVAHGVQHLFYLLLLAQPLLGYLSSSYTQYQTVYLGFELPGWTAPDKAMNEFFSELHEVGGTLLLITIGLHVLGAASHLKRKDGLMRRMLPW
jgi:cytochrome b561